MPCRPDALRCRIRGRADRGDLELPLRAARPDDVTGHFAGWSDADSAATHQHTAAAM